MTTSPRSCAGSASFRRPEAPEARLVWRPSRWLRGILLLLGVLAACALLASEMPRALAWPGVVVVLAHAVGSAWREGRRPSMALLFRAGALSVDGEAVRSPVLQWRGPLAFVRWRDASGRVRRLSWWPDTLPAARRRELRLAGPGGAPARGRDSVAP